MKNHIKNMNRFTFIAAATFIGVAVNTNAQTTQQVETIAQEVKQMEQGATSTLPSTIDGEWTIYNVRGEKVSGEELPSITFVLSEHRFYGNNGCNILNGDFTAEGTDGLKFDNVLSTRRLCKDAPFEYAINTALNDVRFYSIKQYGHEYYLDLMNSRRQVILVLRSHNMNFLDGAWRATVIDSRPNRNEAVEVVIDIAEKHIHGNTGCNILNGDIFIDPDKPNSIQFSKIATTRMMCPDSATETAFLVALEEVEFAYADGNSAIKMYDSHGREVLRFQRVSLDSLRNE